MLRKDRVTLIEKRRTLDSAGQFVTNKLPSADDFRLQLGAIISHPRTDADAEERAQEFVAGMARWATANPAAAAKYLTDNTDEMDTAFGGLAPRAMELALTSIMLEWARQDTAAARQWADQSLGSASLSNGKFGEAVRNGLDALTAATAVLNPQHLRADELENASRNPAQFVQLANGLLDSHHARARFATTVASIDSPTRDRVLRELGQRWAKQLSFSEGTAVVDSLELDATLRFWIAADNNDADLATRFSWYLSGFPDNDRMNGIDPLVSHWTKFDFNATAKWLGDLSPSNERDTAIAAFVSEVVTTEPPSAVDWAQEIADLEIRATVLTQLFQTWRAADEEAATRYFRASNLVTPE